MPFSTGSSQTLPATRTVYSGAPHPDNPDTHPQQEEITRQEADPPTDTGYLGFNISSERSKVSKANLSGASSDHGAIRAPLVAARLRKKMSTIFPTCLSAAYPISCATTKDFIANVHALATMICHGSHAWVGEKR
jgi:hypothetical protein